MGDGVGSGGHCWEFGGSCSESSKRNSPDKILCFLVVSAYASSPGGGFKVLGCCLFSFPKGSRDISLDLTRSNCSFSYCCTRTFDNLTASIRSAHSSAALFLITSSLKPSSLHCEHIPEISQCSLQKVVHLFWTHFGPSTLWEHGPFFECTRHGS